MPMYSEPASMQTASTVQVNDRTPGVFKHQSEHDTAKRVVSSHPGWRGRSGGGYQSNGLGARRTNMAYRNAGSVLPGLGSWFTDIRDAVTTTAAEALGVPKPVAAPAPVQQAAVYIPPASTVNKWLIPAGIAVVGLVAALVLLRRKR